MVAYEPEVWHDLFVMTGGAAAALAGLIFVAVSVNHEAILAIPALPALAARTLSVLIGVVLLCLFGLTPGQSHLMLGLQVLLVGAAVMVMVIVVGTTVRHLRGSERRSWRVSLLAAALVACVPTVLGGASLVAGVGGGLFWLEAAFVTGICVAVYYGWILLIEIRR